MWEVEAVSVVIYVGQVVLAEYQTTKQSKSSLLYTIQAWCMHRMKLKFVYTKSWKRVVTFKYICTQTLFTLLVFCSEQINRLYPLWQSISP